MICLIGMKEHMCLKIVEEKSVKLSENKYLLKCINLKCIIYILFSLFFWRVLERKEYLLLMFSWCHSIFVSANVCMWPLWAGVVVFTMLPVAPRGAFLI